MKGEFSFQKDSIYLAPPAVVLSFRLIFGEDRNKVFDRGQIWDIFGAAVLESPAISAELMAFSGVAARLDCCFEGLISCVLLLICFYFLSCGWFDLCSTGEKINRL